MRMNINPEAQQPELLQLLYFLSTSSLVLLRNPDLEQNFSFPYFFFLLGADLKAPLYSS